MNVFKELYQNRKLIWKLSKNDFRNKFAGAYFGIIWAFIQPMVTVAVYFVVFQLGLRVQPAATGYPYICWLVSGIIPWFFFSDALPSASNCPTKSSSSASVTAGCRDISRLVRMRRVRSCPLPSQTVWAQCRPSTRCCMQ